jgi:cytoskeletal protein RodZ
MAVILTNVGEDWASQRMAGSGTDSSYTGQYVGWGTGAGTAAKADTTLFTEQGSRTAGTVTVSGTGSSAKYQVVATLTASGTLAITNAGNHTLSSGGTLIVHGDHGVVNLALNDSITYTIQIDPQ